MFKPLILAAFATTLAAPALAAPVGCVKPTTANAITVTAPGWAPVVGTAVVGTQKKKDGEVLPGDGADTKVADASDRCPPGYAQQYVQEPATRPIQYGTAPTVVDTTTSSPSTPARPPKN